MASVLGRKYGVTVTIGGTEAYTDGAAIHLPALPVGAPDTLFLGGDCMVTVEVLFPATTTTPA